MCVCVYIYIYIYGHVYSVVVDLKRGEHVRSVCLCIYIYTHMYEDIDYLHIGIPYARKF
jgi:hypothetical protein